MADMQNPFQVYRQKTGLTYLELAEKLGCSHSYAKKLGGGIHAQLHPPAPGPRVPAPAVA